MKPREFDELIRQKFDQNDFGYNPGNWERLEEQLGGGAKKRSILMWWLMPAAGIAASVALAIGFMPRFDHDGQSGSVARTGSSHKSSVQVVQPLHDAPLASGAIVVPTNAEYTRPVKNQVKHISKKPVKKEEATKAESFAINYNNAIGSQRTGTQRVDINLLNSRPVAVNKENEKEKNKEKRTVATSQAVATFRPEAEKKQPKLSVILSGGYSKGNQNSGYSAGASIRRHINEKVFIEGDVAYTNNNLSQGMSRQDWMDYIPAKTASGKANVNAPVMITRGAKTSEDGTIEDLQHPKVIKIPGPIETRNVTYSLSYIQVNPSIGVKLMKRVSLGAGPDFQQVLTDNRPAAESGIYQGVNQKMPMFDVGLTSKAEVSISRNLKAGVAYRKGINNVIAPGGSYIDRDYLQFQLKCAIFNK